MSKTHKPLFIFDCRAFSENLSGIPLFTKSLAKEIEAHFSKKFRVVFFDNRRKKRKLFPHRSETAVFQIPNVFFPFLLKTGVLPPVDILVKRKLSLQDTHPSVFFCPDIRFTKVSQYCKKFVVVHDFSQKHFPQFFSKKSQLFFILNSLEQEIKSADSILTVSESISQELSALYSLPSVCISQCGEHEFLEAKPEKPKEHTGFRYFLMIGTKEPRKNEERAIRAFLRFQKKHPEFVLVRIGKTQPEVFASLSTSRPIIPSTPTRHPERGARHPERVLSLSKGESKDPFAPCSTPSEGIPPQGRNDENPCMPYPIIPNIIEIPRFISPEEKKYWYQNAEALLFPSLYEGFSLPILEASFCSCIPLSGNCPAQREINPYGYCVDPFSEKDIENGLTEIVSLSPQEKKEKQEKIQQWSIKNYSWEKTMEKITSLFTIHHS
jgi:glycosyltransferase involved in cell wall biosynthesis